jgi:hypothetical protein
MRILMLGNSLTSSHQLPQKLAAQLCAEVSAHTRGGARLSEQLNPKTRMGAQTAEALAQGGWDFLVMQEMSVGPAKNRQRYLESAQALSELAHDFGATPVIYATWAFCEGSERLARTGWSYQQMHELLHSAFLQAASENNALLADVGAAFFERHDPSLYAPDGVHPSETGTELAASVIAKTIADASITEGAGK